MVAGSSPSTDDSMESGLVELDAAPHLQCVYNHNVKLNSADLRLTDSTANQRRGTSVYMRSSQPSLRSVWSCLFTASQIW